nr:helix-turn-helix transcriptional regulator [Gordonia sp. C13]
MKLSDVADATGLSTSTLSQLKSCHRRPTLDLLIPLTQTYRVTLDEVVGAPHGGSAHPSETHPTTRPRVSPPDPGRSSRAGLSSRRTRTPWPVNHLNARCKNPALVRSFASDTTSLHANRVRSSIAVCTLS